MSRDPVHAGTAPRLADYARRRLDATGQAEVAAHLPECQECRAMLEAYELMQAAIAETAGGETVGGHLTSAAIADLALPGAASQPAPEEASHLAACRDCADDLRLARAANAAAVETQTDSAVVAPSTGMPGSAFRQESVTRWILPLAAAVAIAFLGLATVRAWRQSGALAARLATLENDNGALQSKVADLTRVVAENRAAADADSGAGARDADGAVSYLFLRGTVRGAGAIERLMLQPGRRSVYLALALDLPAAARHRGESGRVALLGADGRERWSTAIAGEEIDALVARGDSLLLRVPATVLEEGRQEIRLAAASPGAGTRTWFRSEFEISGPGRSR